ncbi:MAG: hypothetical protein ACR2MG_05970 [Pyrinomonadaceae bacterium]
MLNFSCTELYQQVNVQGGATEIKLINLVDFSNYRFLHPEGRRLIKKWFSFGESIWNKNNDNIYEPFIFTWFAFNGWGACITSADTDADIMDSLATNKEINVAFDNFLQENSESDFLSKTKWFFDILPIFDAKELNKLELFENNYQDRETQVRDYYTNLKNHYDNDKTLTPDQRTRKLSKSFSPKCWKRHLDCTEGITLDWSHFLKAVYQVRCNLFHGQKGNESPMNKQNVEASFLTLFNFLKETGFLQR